MMEAVKKPPIMFSTNSCLEDLIKYINPFKSYMALFPQLKKVIEQKILGIRSRIWELLYNFVA